MKIGIGIVFLAIVLSLGLHLALNDSSSAASVKVPKNGVMLENLTVRSAAAGSFGTYYEFTNSNAEVLAVELCAGAPLFNKGEKLAYFVYKPAGTADGWFDIERRCGEYVVAKLAQ